MTINRYCRHILGTLIFTSKNGTTVCSYDYTFDPESLINDLLERGGRIRHYRRANIDYSVIYDFDHGHTAIYNVQQYYIVCPVKNEQEVEKHLKDLYISFKNYGRFTES